MNSKIISEMQESLKTNWTEIVFKKKNGDLRPMRCTTLLTLIPEQYHPEKKEENITEEVDAAFEVDKPVETDKLYSVFEINVGWRSFRESQLVSVNGVELTSD